LAFRTRVNNGLIDVMTIKGGNVGIGTDSPNQPLTVEGAMSMKEQAAANADVGAYGQLWIKDDTPNGLMFTDDAGNDVPLVVGGINYGTAYSAANSTHWLGSSPPTTVTSALDRIAAWANSVNTAMAGAVGLP